MFKSKAEYDLAMKEILIRIRDEKSVDDLIENPDYCDAIVESKNLGYITGIDYWVDANRNLHFDSFAPKITRNGLIFIESFS